MWRCTNYQQCCSVNTLNAIIHAGLSYDVHYKWDYFFITIDNLKCVDLAILAIGRKSAGSGTFAAKMSQQKQ